MKKRSQRNSLVIKGNQLINARYSMTLGETRLFLMVLVQIRREDVDFKPYVIKIRDYVEAVETKSKSYHTELEETCERLLKRILHIPKPEEDGWIKTSLFTKTEYSGKKGTIEMTFDPSLKPYLLQLRRKFTVYDIRNVLSLKSTHSVRIYELLKQFEGLGERTISVTELREMLGILPNQYKNFYSFRKKVILRAQEDLEENCDITFDFDEIKEGRRVETIRFIIRRKPGTFPAPALQNPIEAENDPEWVAELKDMGITDARARDFAETLEPANIRAAIDYAQKQQKKGNIKTSLTAYLIKLLESGFQPVSPFEARQQAPIKKAAARHEEVKLIEKLEGEFAAFRNLEVDELVKNATEDDWIHFQAWAQQQLFISVKLFSEGRFLRDHPDAVAYLRIFLSDRMPERTQAFIDWAGERGYPLVFEAGSFWMVKEKAS